jgi:hypothetical protein
VCIPLLRIEVYHSVYPSDRKGEEHALYGKDEQSDGRSGFRQTLTLREFFLSSISFHRWGQRSAGMGSSAIRPQLFYGIGKCEKSCLALCEKGREINLIFLLFLMEHRMGRRIHNPIHPC